VQKGGAMKAPFAHRKIAFLTAAVVASAGASTLMFSGVTPVIGGKAANILGMMHDRSPGTRAAGATSNKHPRQKVLADAAPAPKKRVSRVLPASVPAAMEAVPPIAGAATPIPAAIAPFASPAALIPAAASKGGFFIPPLFVPPGGGGGIILTPPAATPPPGGGDNPPPVPGVPEPSTWAMMIFGFLFVGGLLRRRKRQETLGAAQRGAVSSAR
jgi:hypothetical protein